MSSVLDLNPVSGLWLSSQSGDRLAAAQMTRHEHWEGMVSRALQRAARPHCTADSVKGWCRALQRAARPHCTADSVKGWCQGPCNVLRAHTALLTVGRDGVEPCNVL
eukprot:160397-Chlamydomonas_euryale.AAC.3